MKEPEIPERELERLDQELMEREGDGEFDEDKKTLASLEKAPLIDYC